MSQKRRILIVEDDPSTMRLLEQIVRRMGHEPMLARKAPEALRWLQTEGADLVLLDLMMREMDGWTLLETIKTDDRLGTLPVVIISAKHPREDPTGTQAHADQFEAYFVKPFEVNELVSKIREILQ